MDKNSPGRGENGNGLPVKQAAELLMERLSEDQARQVCSWSYPGEYSVYNLPDWGTVCGEGWGIADPVVREREFYAVLDSSGSLAGYFRLKEERDTVRVGIGLEPSRCGQGIGPRLMGMVVREAAKRYAGKRILLEVREWNMRARRCYEKAGFAAVELREIDTPSGTVLFWIMEYQG